MKRLEELSQSTDPTKLTEYLAYFPVVVQNLAYWHSMEIFTPKDLGDHLTICAASEASRSQTGKRIRFTSAQEAQAWLDLLKESKDAD